MNKATLSLLASAGSLAAVLLITNSANAFPVIAEAVNPAISTPTAQVINLNRATLMLNLTAQESNPILDQMGCNCAACMKVQSQM